MTEHTTNAPTYKEIPLSGKHGAGKVALVDAADYEWLMQHRWHCYRGTHTDYAATWWRRDGKVTTITMHRLIMQSPANQVDHINRNGLDNRRENLRLATKQQNGFNKVKPFGDHTSRYKGVSLVPSGKAWLACIAVNEKTIYIGRFSTQYEAAIAYNQAALRYHGDFAYLNEIPPERPADDIPLETRNLTSVFIGVHWQANCQKWYAYINHNGKRTSLGYFADELEAAVARDELARTLNSPRIKLNFP